MSDNLLNIEILGDKAAIQRFAVLPTALRDALFQKMGILTGDLRNYVITDKLSGQVLNKITGQLQQSIQKDVESNGLSVTGIVFSAGDAKAYAGAQEYGAHIPERVPVKAQALSWITGGKRVFFARAAAFNLPERSYLRSSLKDKSDDIKDGLQDAVNEGLAKE